MSHHAAVAAAGVAVAALPRGGHGSQELSHLRPFHRAESQHARPAVAERFGEQRLVCAPIDDEHDLLERDQANQFVELEDAAGVLTRKPAQIHQHRVALVHETRQHHLPRVVVTEKVVDAKPEIAIGARVPLAHALLHRGRARR